MAKSWRPWKTYREALSHYYLLKRKKNKSYSLRAYARDLDLSASRLDGILKGKFGLSPIAAGKVADLLQLSLGDKLLFQEMVESEHSRSPISRKAAKASVKKTLKEPSIDQIDHRQYMHRLSWKTFAILEMIENPLFKNDPEWIANCLEISVRETKSLLADLEKSGAVVSTENKLTKTKDFVYVAGTNKYEAIKSFQEEILHKTERSINKRGPGEVAFGSWVISVDQKRIPEAQQVLNEFLQSFCKKFGRLGLHPDEEPFKDRNAVYSISGYFVPLGKLDSDQT